MDDTIAVKTRSRTSRSQTKARAELVRLLKDEHRYILDAFHNFHELLATADLDVAKTLIPRTCDELSRHAAVDRAIVYPAFSGIVNTKPLFDRADIEHQTHQGVIDLLRTMDASDPKLIPAFQVLGSYFRHHVKLEENLISQRRERHDMDWIELLGVVHQKREELLCSSPVRFSDVQYV